LSGSPTIQVKTYFEILRRFAVPIRSSDAYTSQAIPITGPDSLAFGEATATIAEAIGRPLRYEPISDEQARERYAKVSGSLEETEAHVALWRERFAKGVSLGSRMMSSGFLVVGPLPSANGLRRMRSRFLANSDQSPKAGL
jgi:hypothetical protein